MNCKVNDGIEKLEELLIRTGLASKSQLKGCRESEITSLERHFDLHLPGVYKDFLRKMGRRAGSFNRGTDVLYESLFDNRSAFENVLASDGNPFSLNHDALVFSSHQGYIFHFFDTSEHLEDRPVFGYKEGELETRLINESLSGFLYDSALEELELWKK